jgi:hypothetical protein
LLGESLVFRDFWLSAATSFLPVIWASGHKKVAAGRVQKSLPRSPDGIFTFSPATKKGWPVGQPLSL